MNELDLLRKYRDDVPAPDSAMLEQTRALLTTPPPVRRTARRRVIALAGVAAALAVGLVAADVVTKTSPGADAEASQLLGNAADLTVSKPDPVIPPGSYRYVKHRTFALTAAGNSRQVAIKQWDQMEWWVPSSQAPPWIARVTFRQRVEFPVPADEAYARQHYPGLFIPVTNAFTSACGTPDSYSMVMNPDETVDGPISGTINGNGCTGDWREPTAQFLAALPRDPGALLQQLRAVPDTNPDPDSTAFERIGTVLASGIVPSDLRAALYRAAQHIPGVHVVDGVVNLDGATGRAVTRSADEVRTDLILNPTTGAFLGLRRVATKTTDYAHQGDLTQWTALTSHLTTTPPPKP